MFYDTNVRECGKVKMDGDPCEITELCFKNAP